VQVEGHSVLWNIKNNELSIEIPAANSPAGRVISIKSHAMAPNVVGQSEDSRQLGACIDTRSIRWSDRLPGGGAPRPDAARRAINNYTRVLANSQYTARWIERRWQVSPGLLYPPIDTGSFRPNSALPKEKLILSVGRFFSGGHNKKHHEIASAFIRMHRNGIIPKDWRLVMIGALHREHSDHQEYFRKLAEMSSGHPIELLPDAPFAVLLEHYQRASIYWHGAGWGENANRFPERFEHFGMTTCEAMACACVPVVYDAGGQREVVSDSAIGYRYRTSKELDLQMGALTRASATDLAAIGARAQASVERFAQSQFPQRVLDAFRGLL
jgi:glycosyltransferase involved in cell wall biosynthesis